MKVAHLVIGGEVAGGQLVALRLARAARDAGHEALFVAPVRGHFTALVEADGFDVHVIDVGRLFRLRALATLRSLIRRERIELVHTHTLAAANALGRIGARFSGARVVSHLHIENHFRAATAPVLRTLDNVTARLCSALVAVSEDTRLAYERQGYPRRIEVVYNGVDGEFAGAGDRVREEFGVPNGAPLVGEIGRLCDVKGQRELIAALADVPDVRAMLVGADLEQDGAFQVELERRAADLGVRDRVVFAGRRDDVPDVLAALDVVVLPSLTEGLPLVVLEAMAARRPVVATSVGGTPELVVDGETGLLVPPRDAGALADALRRLTGDRALRERMGEAGYRRVRERFSADATTGRILEIYEEALR